MRENGSNNWALFFPPGARVLALPSWRSPRLYLSTRDPLQRWEQSSFYPAFSLKGRLWRFLLRSVATLRAAKARTAHSSEWSLGRFAQDVFPQPALAVVMVGTPGPTQKLIVQLRDEKGRVLGYLKYAEKEAACRRLRHELYMLSNLPQEIGPELVKFGPLDAGEALLERALPGNLLSATLPPPKDLSDLLNSLIVLPPVPLETHPWVRRMRDSGIPESDAWFEPLAGRSWPIVVQHGDFAPWNLLRRSDGKLQAVDWEFGTLEGFPYLDLAHYVLQTSALIYRRAPLQAARYAVEYLSEQPGLALNSSEARALVRLAAYDAYQKALEDGCSPDGDLQPWRRTIWKVQ